MDPLVSPSSSQPNETLAFTQPPDPSATIAAPPTGVESVMVAPEPVGVSTQLGKGPTGPPPSYLICPISLVPMRDPVVTLDGHSYERVAIGKRPLNYRNRLILLFVASFPSRTLTSPRPSCAARGVTQADLHKPHDLPA